MNDDDADIYGDTDPNNIPEDDADADPGAPTTSARPASTPTTGGDGRPGYPVEGQPGWRAGAFGSGDGLLGLIKVSNPAGGGDAGPSMPSAYMPDGHGGVALRPDFAATHPKGPFDFAGMGKEIDWPGAALDLGKIAASAGASLAAPFVPGLLGLGAAPAEAVGAAGSGATPNPWMTGGALTWKGARTLHNQQKANPRNADPVMKPDVDQAS